MAGHTCSYQLKKKSANKMEDNKTNKSGGDNSESEMTLGNLALNKLARLVNEGNVEAIELVLKHPQLQELKVQGNIEKSQTEVQQ